MVVAVCTVSHPQSHYLAERLLDSTRCCPSSLPPGDDCRCSRQGRERCFYITCARIRDRRRPIGSSI